MMKIARFQALKILEARQGVQHLKILTLDFGDVVNANSHLTSGLH